MCTVSPSRQSRKPAAREIKTTLVDISDCGHHVTLADERGRETKYYLQPFQCQFTEGVAIRFIKECGEMYEVFFSMKNPQNHLCDCMGFTRYGYCRHTDYVRCALENEWLPGQRNVQPVNAEQAREECRCEFCGCGIHPFDSLCGPCQREAEAAQARATPVLTADAI